MNELASKAGASSCLTGSCCAESGKEIAPSRKIKMSPVTIRVFKISSSYNYLCFSVFNITNIKNKVNVKYKTKNNITDVNDVFLSTKNQKKTKNSSRMNLRLTATRLCMTFESGSFCCPLKKIARLIKTRTPKTDAATAASLVLNPMMKMLLAR
jgi:hypothetical protein